jgi:hypothetical protein
MVEQSCRRLTSEAGLPVRNPDPAPAQQTNGVLKMRKLVLLVVLAAGILIGSKLGPVPYEKLDTQVRRFRRRPEVAQTTAAAKQIVHEEVADLVARATDRAEGTPLAPQRNTA